MTILSCPGCDHRLRVPDNKRGTVTCPLCGSEWFHPETIELSSVEFRCSASGAKFNVISSRRSPLHKFTVQKVEKAVPKATGPLEAGSPRSPPQPKPRNASPALPPAAPGVVGWLARMVGRKTDLTQSLPPRTTPMNTIGADFSAPTARRPVSSHAAEAIWHVTELSKLGKTAAFTNASAAVRDLSVGRLRHLRTKGSPWKPIPIGRICLPRYARGKVANLPTQPFQLQRRVSQRSDKHCPSGWCRGRTTK